MKTFCKLCCLILIIWSIGCGKDDPPPVLPGDYLENAKAQCTDKVYLKDERLPNEYEYNPYKGKNEIEWELIQKLQPNDDYSEYILKSSECYYFHSSYYRSMSSIKITCHAKYFPDTRDWTTVITISSEKCN